uniref:Uncharacterized protein n=1 Tax=Pseudomonas phage vB_PaeS_HTN2 TaxID=3236647 RepID=A0AB39AI36_9VIRU
MRNKAVAEVIRKGIERAVQRNEPMYLCLHIQALADSGQVSLADHRRFMVWLDRAISGVDDVVQYLEFKQPTLHRAWLRMYRAGVDETPRTYAQADQIRRDYRDQQCQAWFNFYVWAHFDLTKK